MSQSAFERLGFVRNPLSRHSAERDHDLVARHLADAGALTIAIAGEIPILRRDGAGMTGLLPLADLERVETRHEQAFLGTIDGRPVFGTALDASAAETFKRGDEHLAIDLRSIAVQGLVPADELGILAEAKALLFWHSRHRFCAELRRSDRGLLGRLPPRLRRLRRAAFPAYRPGRDHARPSRRALPARPPGALHRQLYSCLAGFIEPGETIEDAVRRETFEEAGIEVGAVRYVASQPWPFPSSLMIGCFGEALTEAITLDRDELEDGALVREGRGPPHARPRAPGRAHHPAADGDRAFPDAELGRRCRRPAERCRCCIVGGGPAGMMLGFLLARAGVDVVVLEKHADFLRDFRGDTIHPSTLELMHELGLLDEFLRAAAPGGCASSPGMVGDDRAHARRLRASADALPLHRASCRSGTSSTSSPRRRQRYPAFRLRMQAEVTDLIEEDGRVVGVRATTPEGALEIRADLVVGADGRHSTVRETAGLAVEDIGAPMDVLWFRLSRAARTTPTSRSAASAPGSIFVMLNRGDYWQCALRHPEGRRRRAAAQQGLDGVPRARRRARAVRCADRVGELQSWDDVKLLTVAVDRLRDGTGPGCCASATRRTRCRRSAASASTSRSRTPSRPPTSSTGRCATAR